VGISSSKEMKLLESINVAMTPRQPLGMTPAGVAVSPDQKRLYVTCSDANVVAVADVSEPRSKLAGFVPTGWYPTAARELADGRLIVLNGRGLGSYPNPEGPTPLRRSEVHQGDARKQHVGNLQTGTMSVITGLNGDTLADYTKLAQNLSPYRDSMLEVESYPDTSVIY